MRYLKVFENFEESGKLKAGMIIEDSYFTNNGTFVIQTNEGKFEIACAGGANVVVSGDSNTGKIVNVDNQFTIITIELEGGKKIVIEDETGGEGLEIYEVEQSEDNTESEKNLNISDVISRKSKVYVISLRKDTVNPSSRKLFLDKKLAIKYLNEVGMDEYTYWEESIYDL